MIPQVAPHLRGMRVLVVEDNEINREVAIELLTDAGLLVDTAENGRIACARILESGQHYDAVLMDVQMPEMDGVEATARIRLSRSSDSLPIIAMTAHAYEAERQRCFEAGMNDHVAKPVDPAVLISTLGRWLKSSNLTTAEARTFIPPRLISELPDSLPPFDFKAGLRRVNGKRPLLRKLIVDFANSFAGAVPKLRTQIAAQSLDEARRLAHTLKGVAGSLEIREVAQAAAEVEDALANRILLDISEHLDRLELVILPAIAAAATLKSITVEASAVTLGTADYTAFNPIIVELRDLLQRRSLRARKVFETLEQAIGPQPAAAGLLPVRVALDRLDFDAAITELNRLDRFEDGSSANQKLVEFS